MRSKQDTHDLGAHDTVSRAARYPMLQARIPALRVTRCSACVLDCIRAAQSTRRRLLVKRITTNSRVLQTSNRTHEVSRVPEEHWRIAALREQSSIPISYTQSVRFARCSRSSVCPGAPRKLIKASRADWAMQIGRGWNEMGSGLKRRKCADRGRAPEYPPIEVFRTAELGLWMRSWVCGYRYDHPSDWRAAERCRRGSTDAIIPCIPRGAVSR